MIDKVIAGDVRKRRRALAAGREAIEARIELFDGVLDSLDRYREPAAAA
jgi:hypothetical protein